MECAPKIRREIVAASEVKSSELSPGDTLPGLNTTKSIFDIWWVWCLPSSGVFFSLLLLSVTASEECARVIRLQTSFESQPCGRLWTEIVGMQERKKVFFAWDNYTSDPRNKCNINFSSALEENMTWAKRVEIYGSIFTLRNKFSKESWRSPHEKKKSCAEKRGELSGAWT